MKAYGLKKCSTCQKAIGFLEGKKVAFTFTDHSVEPPTATQVKRWAKALEAAGRNSSTVRVVRNGLPDADRKG
ncbi:MAG: hypothetical protein U1E15_00835 [Hyphomicrobiales bacterium]